MKTETEQTQVNLRYEPEDAGTVWGMFVFVYIVATACAALIYGLCQLLINAT